MRDLSTLLFLLLTGSLAAQFNGAESVEYDPAGDRYFVSNTQSHVISILEQGGAVSTFASGLGSGPHGLELLGDTLYACSGGRLKGFLRTDGSQVADIDLSGTFLNGLTTDGTHLYATDFSQGRIHKVDPVAGTSTPLVSQTIFTPNGIVYDPTLDRLVVVAWGSNAGIHAVDPVSGAMSLLTNTGLTNLDGVTIDCNGQFWVTSWTPDQLTQYDPSFALPGIPAVGVVLNNAADIDYDPVNNLVCVPNSGNNSVVFHTPGSCTTGVGEAARPAVSLWPNPATELLRVGGVDPGSPYRVFDASGREVLAGRVAVDGVIAVGILEAGRYHLLLEAGAMPFVVQR